MIKVGFPSIGDIVRYLFNTSGFLALGTGDHPIFMDEKKKKSFQTSLKRLAEESHEIRDTLNKTLISFKDCLQDVVPNEKATVVIISIVDDCMGQYGDLVRKEASHLSLIDSVKWTIKSRLINRICLSHQKHYHRANLHDTTFIMPKDLYWFLPSLNDKGKIDWPIKKSLNWAYTQIGTSQSRFHYPSETIDIENYREQQNRQNASRWASGKPMRSWVKVKENLEQSFLAMEDCPLEEHHRDIQEEVKKSIIFTVWIARLSTVICQDILKYFGDEFLFSCIEQFKDISEELITEHLPLSLYVNQEINKHNIQQQKDRDRLWLTATDDFWYHKSGGMIEFTKLMSPYLQTIQKEEGLSAKIPDEVIRIWNDIIGEYTVNSLLRGQTYSIEEIPSDSFINLYSEFINIRKSVTCSWDDIHKYESKVREHELTPQLDWAVQWLKACWFYRQENYKEAHPHYEKAFIDCKYTAGERQYDLVNQYAESCAKNKDWIGFKKSVAWANYIGLKIRWLRNKPETNENLEFTYFMLKNATYSHL